MKKIVKIILIIIGIIMVLIVSLFIATGLTKNPKVEIINYSVNEDSSELNFTIGIPESIGYTRGYKNRSDGIKSHYLNFYNTFGVINSNWGAKFEFTLELDDDDTEVYFNRTGGGNELVLQKNEETGEWERPNKSNEMKRYAEIKESAKKASEQFLRATHPNCTISNEFSETYTTSGFENASWLINNGLIKKSELLDVDKKSYCDVNLKYWSYFENPLDHQRNCEVYYQIYLKCKNYEDKGYVEW